MKTEENLPQEWKDEKLVAIEISRWNLKRMLQKEGNNPKILFIDIIIDKIPPQAIVCDFRDLFISTNLLVLRIKFYFKYSYIDNYFEPYNSVKNPQIEGSFVFSEKKKKIRNILAYELYIKDCPGLPGNFHKTKYSPKDKFVMKGSPLINKYIEEQRNFEKEFEVNFYK